MSAIEPLGVDAVELLHATREIGLRRLDKEMVVIGHQAVGMTDPAKPLNSACENFQKTHSIDVVKKDLSTSIPATGNVIHSTFVFDSQWSSHESSIAGETLRI